MKYLVTGGAGFIGSHLVDSLILGGHEVIVLDSLISGKKENINKKAQFVLGDITNKSLVQELMHSAQFCYHLAALPSVQQSIEQWHYCNQVNLGGSINIFEAASLAKVPVIYASSAAVYGAGSSGLLTESQEVKPLSPYGLDKYCNEQHAKLFNKIHGLRSVGLRFFNVYGPRQDPSSYYSGVISIFLQKILHNESIQIFGDGAQMRDFIHVADIVQALLIARNNEALGNAEIFNVCTSVGSSINQLADTIAIILGNRLQEQYMPCRPGDIMCSIGDNSKIRNILGFANQYNLQQGLEHLIKQNS